MGAKFQQATDACLMGNNRDMDRLMKEAEQELGKMAAALVPYSLIRNLRTRPRSPAFIDI